MKKIMFSLAVAALMVLALPSQVDAYGAAHVGYTHVGPSGVYHTGGTVAAGPRGVAATGHTTAVGAGGGVYHSGGAAGVGYGGAAGGYHYGYGSTGYGGVGYGGGYHYGSNYSANAAAAAANGAYR
ncbi:MAG: hypothetical protein K8U57_33655 [Planctomycetes bacterium]|nr:hypothetical protein [Planctomycetota bacterium]